MPRPNFKPLAQELLDAGIAPRFANRLRRELEDHYRDLEREAFERERSAEAAASEAGRRLGSERAIADECLARPELMSWIYRSRWLVCCLRGVCRIYLLARAGAQALASWCPAILRFAAAGSAAVCLMGAMLLALETSIRFERPDPVAAYPVAGPAGPAGPAGNASRLAEPVARVAHVETRAAEPRAAPVRRDVAAPLPARPAVPAPELYDVALRVRPMVAVDVELRPDALPSMQLVDGDLLPIVKVAPQFPVVAERRGIEGYVLIEYTVTRTGAVSDIVVVESSSEVFERPALDAVSKFKYKPRIVDGRAVPVRGVRARMRFVIEA